MTELYLPALRGIFGAWIYYTCLVPVKTVAERITYAREIHTNKNLSDLIQRELKKGRGKEIANYLITKDERFFNSLVVAVYEGEPEWLEFENIQLNKGTKTTKIPEEAQHSLGYLHLTGEEKLFALDGQHRLAGIKTAITDKKYSGKSIDEISVIFVAHRNTEQGLERTRRLFTTLNKTAKAVSKGEIIALDEDDVMAIIVRKLVEQHSYFKDDRVLNITTNTMPASNLESITTIGNLYDVLEILFGKIQDRTPKSKLRFQRPSDKKIKEYYDLSSTFFELMGKAFPELGKFFTSNNYAPIVQKNRGNKGGHILFRPAGLKLFTELMAKMPTTMSVKERISLISNLPVNLEDAPYEGIMWDGNKLVFNNLSLLKRVLEYMLNLPVKNQQTLLEDYREALEKPTAKLPKKVA